MEIWERYEAEELFALTAKLVRNYTGHESTSVTFEKAEQLMEAVLYCIMEYEQEHGAELWDPESGTVGMASLAYEQGYELVVRKVRKMRRLYNLILKNFCSYGNRNYEDTVLKGIPQFFLRYDARFKPQDHILTLDYPLLLPVAERMGIDAIEHYLGCIHLEQKFLGAFDEGYVCRVLAAYDGSYRDQFYNLCGILVRNVLGHVMAGKTEDAAFVVRDYEWLEGFGKSRTNGKFPVDMREILHRLVKERWNGDELLYEYLAAAFN